MMAGCCAQDGCGIDELQGRQSRILRIVLAINALMFIVEITAGLMAGSTSLLADSLDMLGDALVYGFSLYVVGRSDVWKAASALSKGTVMALFGIFVLGQAAYKSIHVQTPAFQAIGIVGFAALAANAVCVLLLVRHRADDVNMRSVWICARNDIVANVAVLAAAAGVWASGSQWPDLAVGLGIAVLFLRSAGGVLHDASRTYAEARAG